MIRSREEIENYKLNTNVVSNIKGATFTNLPSLEDGDELSELVEIKFGDKKINSIVINGGMVMSYLSDMVFNKDERNLIINKDFNIILGEYEYIYLSMGDLNDLHLDVCKFTEEVQIVLDKKVKWIEYPLISSMIKRDFCGNIHGEIYLKLNEFDESICIHNALYENYLDAITEINNLERIYVVNSDFLAELFIEGNAYSFVYCGIVHDILKVNTDTILAKNVDRNMTIVIPISELLLNRATFFVSDVYFIYNGRCYNKGEVTSIEFDNIIARTFTESKFSQLDSIKTQLSQLDTLKNPSLNTVRDELRKNYDILYEDIISSIKDSDKYNMVYTGIKYIDSDVLKINQ